MAKRRRLDSEQRDPTYLFGEDEESTPVDELPWECCIVSKEQLASLFRRCQTCGGELTPPNFVKSDGFEVITEIRIIAYMKN